MRRHLFSSRGIALRAATVLASAALAFSAGASAPQDVPLFVTASVGAPAS